MSDWVAIPTVTSSPAASKCNSQKGERAAEDFLRGLYRERRLTASELAERLRALDALASGKVPPVLAAAPRTL